ncbi:ArnT family glycosyltransferase [Chitinimonas lacunae]|uniref:ArnT family glycosyltransferase n=1 Tax=Chitinimonas lacunae TaxID=1963018 RepID=A0ABV8MTT6_9NEIS
MSTQVVTADATRAHRPRYNRPLARTLPGEPTARPAMLTYTDPSEQTLPPATEKPWLLILLCLAWLLPGLIGHQPLKPDEIVSAAVVRQFLAGQSWALPLLGAEAWVEHGPLYYWAAALVAGMGQWFGLPIHDGARIAAGLFTGTALWATGLTGRALLGRRHGRSAVLILVGSLGLLLPGHAASSDSAVLAGWCIGLYGLTLAARRAAPAGVVLAVALTLLGLAGSLLEPVLLLTLAIGLRRFPHWHGSRLRGALLLALGLSLPLLTAWPLALWLADRASFALWWEHFALGPLGGFADLRVFHPFGYYLQLLPWFAWPAWLIAAATLWMQRQRLAEPRFQLPLGAAGLVLAMLLLSDTEKMGYALLLLPPLALIGAAGLDVMRRGAAAFLNWFGIMTFGVIAVFLWLNWGAIHFGWPRRMAERVHELSPSFVAEFSLMASLVAVAMTLAWLWAVSRRRPMGRQAVTNWAAGATLGWGLAIAIVTGWVDARTSYRDFARALAPHLPRQACITSENLGPSQRAVLDYYLDVATIRRERRPQSGCDWLLRQGGRERLSPPTGWREVWQGGRPGDRNERYYLYQRE